MKYGFYSDNELTTIKEYPFRCPSWDPMPDGKKNAVILGCSHTWGVGLETHETWAHKISQHNTDRIRYWNLGQPGASPESVVRMLYSCEKVLHPNIIIVMWPEMSRRERLENHTNNLLGTHETLRHENAKTDINNFLKSVFFLEKFAEKNNCLTMHCFSDNYTDFRTDKDSLLLEDYTLRNCWPHWDKFTARDLHPEPSLAGDGVHYGAEHHERFAELFLRRFGAKLI
jgi:hypothetical protein|tara:strand:+ start:100 stop:783 length:684 start_codon:yes stop_codon:yes gene_type:complete